MSEAGSVEKAKDLAERLFNVAIDVAILAKVDLDEQWARNPKIVGLTLLSRSLNNFRAAMVLLKTNVHVVEARILARCIYENLIWAGALRERGFAFVQEMLEDEQANREALVELTFKASRLLGGDPSDEAGMELRALLNASRERFPGSIKLRTDKVAKGTVIESAYNEYSRLSLEAVHCSITALGRHLTRDYDRDTYFLTLNIEPKPTDREVLNTIVHLCRGLLWVTVTANELVGFTPKSEELRPLEEELAQIAQWTL